MTAPDEPEIVILFNYNCGASWAAAALLEEQLGGRRFGSPSVYASDPNDFGKAAADGVINPWYPDFRRLAEAASSIVVLVSTELSRIRGSAEHDEKTSERRYDDETAAGGEAYTGGCGLLSEILYLRHRSQEAPGWEAKVIPICVGCDIRTLQSARGHYEQLQDIAVPFLAGLDPLHLAGLASEYHLTVPVLARSIANRAGLAKYSGA